MFLIKLCLFHAEDSQQQTQKNPLFKYFFWSDLVRFFHKSSDNLNIKLLLLPFSPKKTAVEVENMVELLKMRALI